MGSLSQDYTNFCSTGNEKGLTNIGLAHRNTYDVGQISFQAKNSSAAIYGDRSFSTGRTIVLPDTCGSGLTSTQRNMSGEVTVPGSTIPEMVEHWGCTLENEIPAFVSINAAGQKQKLSRKEVLDLSKRFAHKLNSFGVKKGDIVCNALPNSLERVVCEFGIQFSGAASMNGQVLRSDGEDFFDALRTSQCVAVITDPHVPKSAWHVLRQKVDLACESSVQSEHLPVQSEHLPVESDQLPHLKTVILCTRDKTDSHCDFITSLKNPELPQLRADVSPLDLATVLTTSGSTGYSKLVKLTQANICHFCKQVKAIEPLSSGAHFVNCAQLGWAGGYPQWYLSCGVTRHFIDMHDGPPPDIPSLLWKIMVQEKIVYGFLTPMYVNAILTKCPWQTAKWKPKILCLAGQPIKKGHLEIIGKLCEAVDVNYGMTECNVVTTHRIVDPLNYTDGCAGYPGYEVKIKVVDINRQEVLPGTVGEILLWSPSLCSGYLNNESARSAFTDDGWFCTDDAGYVGSDGKVYVEGRQSDSIHRGVYILYPGWLEKKMRDFPSVRDIAVVAVPDKVLHNEICACVVVNGVKGVVAGCLNNSDSKLGPSIDGHHLEDDVDRAVLIKNNLHVHKPLTASVSDTIFKPPDSAKSPESTCDMMPKKDTNKQFSHETKVSSDHIENSENKASKTKDSSVLGVNLLLLEKELRCFTNDLNLLHEKDAMRMVPKYYVFMDTFPVTSTGKISRREIRKMAAAALGLE